MKVALEIGAEIDIPSHEEIRKIVTHALSENASVVKKLRSGDTMPTAGVAVADLGSPPDGKLWDLRSVWVSGSDPSTTVTSAKALVGVGALPVRGTLVTALEPTEFYILFASVPNQTTFSKDEATILPHEHLFVVISGAASTTQLFVGAQVIMTPQRMAERFEW